MALGVQISTFPYVGPPVLSEVFGYYRAPSSVQIQRIQISAQTTPVGGNISVTLVNVAGTSLGAVAVLASGTDTLDYQLPAPITLASGGVVRAQFTGIDNGTASDLVVNLIGATSQGPAPAPSGCGPGNTACLPPQGTLLLFKGSVTQEVQEAAGYAASASASATAAAAAATAAAASEAAAAASETAAAASVVSAGTQATNAATSSTSAAASANTANTQAGIATAAAAAVAGLDAAVALLTVGSTQTIATASATAVSWQLEQFDDNDFWSITNPTRLTVPAGVTRVRLSAGIRWVANGTGERKLSIRFNPAGTYEANSIFASDDRPSDDTGDATVTTGIIPVVAGDYFEVVVEQDSGGDLDLLTTDAAANHGNYFCIQATRQS